MMVEEARRVAQSVASGEFEGLSRFRGNFRPFRLCKHFLLSDCHRGKECTYAHSYGELHPASPELPRLEEGDTSAIAEQGKVSESKAPDLRMQKKRELCNNFKNNECILGKTCPYAHGEHELGKVELVVTDRIKTKICKHWKEGKCIFGSHCVSAHGETEIGQKRPPFTNGPPMKRRRDGDR